MVLVGLAAALLLAVPSAWAGDDSAPGLLGCPKRANPCGEIVHLGHVDDTLGRVGIAARSFDGLGGGFCSSFERGGFGLGHCRKGEIAPRGDAGTKTYSAGVSRLHNQTSTLLDGSVAAEAASIDLLFRRNGKAHARHAKFLVPTEENLHRLGDPAPFGLFEATIRGCVSFTHVRLKARDEAGNVIGVEREDGYGNFCGQHLQNGSAIVAFRGEPRPRLSGEAGRRARLLRR